MDTDTAQTRRAQLDSLHNDGVLTDAEYEDALTRVDQHGATAAEAVAQATDLPVPDAEQLVDGLAPAPPTAVAPVPPADAPVPPADVPIVDAPVPPADVPVPPADVPIVDAPVPPADVPIADASESELELEA